MDWSFPSIIVRCPAVTQNKSQLMHVMNEVWYSDAFAPKFVLRKLFSIYELHLYQEETYISTALHCAYTQEQGYDTEGSKRRLQTSLMQRSAGNACTQSLIHLLNVHSLIETTQHRVINVVVVTTCYWLTNNSQVSIHNVHSILIYNIITHVYICINTFGS